MIYDDRKLRAQVREETLREVADHLIDCARIVRRKFSAYDELAGIYDDSAEYFANLADECRRPAPTEDDGFTTVHPPVWPAIDGGLDG